jgi:hypothetical protein
MVVAAAVLLDFLRVVVPELLVLVAQVVAVTVPMEAQTEVMEQQTQVAVAAAVVIQITPLGLEALAAPASSS